jgi:hypothetical protein
VGVFLTVVTVLGLLGVPYYIKNEVTAHLQDREREFTGRTNEVLAYSRLLVVLRAKYDGERYRFDGDVLRLVVALDKDKDQGKDKQPDNDTGPSFLDPASELMSLISAPDFSEVVAGSSVARRPLEVPESLQGKQVLPATVLIISSKGLALDTGGMEAHPIRNGTYQGSIKDFKYRIAVLEALRRSIETMQNEMLSLGNFAEAKGAEAVSVDTLQSKTFQQLFTANLTSVVNAFLSRDEQAEFARWQNLYTLGYKVSYAPSPVQPNKDVAR